MHNCVSLMNSLCLQHALTEQDGIAQSYLNGVELFRTTQAHCKTPMMYRQGLIILIQGNKVGSIADRHFAYGPEQSLLTTAPYPLECETSATPDNPVTGLWLSLDPVLISALIEQIQAHQDADYFDGEHSFGIDLIAHTPRLQQSIEALLCALQSPMESALLGPEKVRELFYQLLTGPKRHVLAQLCQQDHALQRVIRAINYIQAHCQEKLSIEVLAEQAQMSTSAFHRAFKRSVADSPLQYIKKVRLNKAKSLITHQGMSANAAAFAVGYESAPQFSREFKRYFGLPPSQAVQIGLQAVSS